MNFFYILNLLLNFGKNMVFFIAERNDRVWIPSTEEFNFKVFDTIPGERDPKTGMIPVFLSVQVTGFLESACKYIFFVQFVICVYS